MNIQDNPYHLKFTGTKNIREGLGKQSLHGVLDK